MTRLLPSESLRTRTVGLLLAIVLLGSSLLTVAPTIASAATVRTSLPALESEVMCVTCKIPLAVAQSVQAEREREYIQTLIAKGLTKTQVKRALISQYGQSVIASPSTHGFGLVAYLIPIAVVLLLIGILVTLLPAWRRHARSRAAHPLAGTAPLSPTDTARLDADLARFD